MESTKNFVELFTVCWSKGTVQNQKIASLCTPNFCQHFHFLIHFYYEIEPKSRIWSSYLDGNRKQMRMLAFRYILAVWLPVCWLFFIVLITSSSTWHILDLGHQHFSALAESDKELLLCLGAGAVKNYPGCLWLSNSNEIIIEGCINPLTAENALRNFHTNVLQGNILT